MRAARRRRVSTLICSRSTTTEVRTTETSTITYALAPRRVSAADAGRSALVSLLWCVIMLATLET
jgi:hypothetical protein